MTPPRSPSNLIILGSSPTALAVAREAAGLGLQAHLVDTAPGLARLSRRVRSCHITADSDAAGLAVILDLAKRGRCALIGCSDPWVKCIRTHRRELRDAGLQILQASDEALDACLDKAAFVLRCREWGIPVPASWFVSHEARPQTLRFPLLVRPLTRTHGQPESIIPKAREVADENQLQTLLATFRTYRVEPLVAESLLGRNLAQYSVGFSRNHQEFELFVAKKVRPLPQHCDVGSFVELQPDAQIEAIARQLIEALEYQGIGEVEILRDETSGECFVIEVNARPWLQYALAPASGHGFLALLLGLPHSGRPVKTGHRWLSARADLRNCWSRSRGDVRHGRIDPWTYCASLWRANVYARFAWSDPAPAWPMLARLPLFRGPGDGR